MANSGILICASAVIGIIVLSVSFLLHRAFAAMERVSGSGARSMDRERKDYLNMIQRMVEKGDSKNLIDITRLHAQERMESDRMAASVDREMVKGGDGRVYRGEDEYGTIEESMH